MNFFCLFHRGRFYCLESPLVKTVIVLFDDLLVSLCLSITNNPKMFQHMSESRRMLDRGHKTDSYIKAVQGNPVPITLPKSDETQREAFIIEETEKPVGLTNEELNYYRNDSFWKTLRRILFILFWLTWVLLFCIAILLITRSPGCDIREHKWWEG